MSETSYPPEAPQPLDLLSALVCLAVAETVKLTIDAYDRRASKKDQKKLGELVRKVLPLTLLFVGATTRGLLELLGSGEPLQVALMRGAISGGASVWAHAQGRASTGSSTFLVDVVRWTLKKVFGWTPKKTSSSEMPTTSDESTHATSEESSETKQPPGDAA